MKSYSHHKGMQTDTEKTLWLTFDQWVRLYKGDPDNWETYKETAKSTEKYFYDGICPKYIYVNPKYNRNSFGYQEYYLATYVKFKTKRDYHKYLRFLKRLDKNLNDLEQIELLTELSTTIQARAKIRAQEAEEKVKQLLDKNLELINQITQIEVDKNE